MEVIPSIDVTAGRSRIVYWPGVASGTGAPTDRPERIAQRFVELGARAVHVVDFEGARSGAPANLEVVGRIASTVAVPIQLAGGCEGADNIRLAFAAGATRVVLSMSVVEDPQLIRDCLGVAGEWLAVGLDPRPERFAAFPWRRPAVPSLETVVEDLVGLGVGRLVLSHGGSDPELAVLRSLKRRFGVDLLVAGGVHDLDAIRRLRDAGAAGVILGEPLLSGAIEFPAALEAAA
ncbi:MAG TPA: HisA/HisF-related TIM barrel protein [Candidatus Limnocylindrales bacterium]